MVDLQPMPDDWQRCLALVAHPDDLAYALAGAAARWTDAGKEVTYLIATRGEAGIDGMAPEEAARVREDEERASAGVLGVQRVEFLERHHDGVLEYGPALRSDFAAGIRRHRPELVVTLNHRDVFGPGIWNTPDHRAVGRAVLDAAGDAGNRWIFPELAEDGLAPWDGVRWVAVAGSPEPTHAVDISDTLDRAVAALLEHRAYLAGLTDEPPEEYARNLLDGFATQMGERFGGQKANTFELFAR